MTPPHMRMCCEHTIVETQTKAVSDLSPEQPAVGPKGCFQPAELRER